MSLDTISELQRSAKLTTVKVSKELATLSLPRNYLQLSNDSIFTYQATHLHTEQSKSWWVTADSCYFTSSDQIVFNIISSSNDDDDDDDDKICSYSILINASYSKALYIENTRNYATITNHSITST